MGDLVGHTVDVRKLISVYENYTPHMATKIRSMSVGNLLGNDVIVKTHDYNNLSDIEDALEMIDQKLTQYQVYSKKVHVEFQETLFTVLTSVINIEADPTEDPMKKKNLITKTQKLVTVLNHKLPNSTPPKTMTGGIQRKTSKSDLQKESIDNNNAILVQTRKQNFRSTNVVTPNSHVMAETQYRNDHLGTPDSVFVEDIPKDETQTALSVSANDMVDGSRTQNEHATVEESVSVIKLRGIFEQKEKENKTGLELIIKPKTFQYQVHIPYTANNLGSYRLFRANSGNYINQVGILNRANLNAARSSQDLSYKPFKDQQEERKISPEDYDPDSESSSVLSDSESLESVKEADMRYSVLEDGRKSPLFSTVSVKETVEAFENSNEEVFSRPLEESLNDQEDFTLVEEIEENDQRRSSLIRRISVKETVEAFEISNEEQVPVHIPKSSITPQHSSSLPGPGEKNSETENVEVKNDSERKALKRRFSVKETVEAFENFQEEDHVYTSKSTAVLKQSSLKLDANQNFVDNVTPQINDKKHIPLLRTGSVREVVQAFETSKEEEVNIHVTKSSIILKHSANSNGSVNGTNVEIEDMDYDIPIEITSISQIPMDSITLKEADNKFDSLVKRNNLD